MDSRPRYPGVSKNTVGSVGRSRHRPAPLEFSHHQRQQSAPYPQPQQPLPTPPYQQSLPSPSQRFPQQQPQQQKQHQLPPQSSGLSSQDPSSSRASTISVPISGTTTGVSTPKTARSSDGSLHKRFTGKGTDRRTSGDSKPRLNKEQHEILESEFQKQSKPTTSQKRAYSDKLGVPLDKVNNWFQNRRAKSKQDAKKQQHKFNTIAHHQYMHPGYGEEGPGLPLADYAYIDQAFYQVQHMVPPRLPVLPTTFESPHEDSPMFQFDHTPGAGPHPTSNMTNPESAFFGFELPNQHGFNNNVNINDVTSFAGRFDDGTTTPDFSQTSQNVPHALLSHSNSHSNMTPVSTTTAAQPETSSMHVNPTLSTSDDLYDSLPNQYGQWNTMPASGQNGAHGHFYNAMPAFNEQGVHVPQLFDGLYQPPTNATPNPWEVTLPNHQRYPEVQEPDYPAIDSPMEPPPDFQYRSFPNNAQSHQSQSQYPHHPNPKASTEWYGS